MGKKGQELILDYGYYYKGSLNIRLKIVEEVFEDRYPQYSLVNDYGECMFKAEDWSAVCQYMIELFKNEHN